MNDSEQARTDDGTLLDKLVDFVKPKDSDTHEDTPAYDLRKSLAIWITKAKGSYRELQHFVLTRQFVFEDIAFLVETPDAELRTLGLLTPWRFNVMQSALCGAAGSVLGYLLNRDKPSGSTGHNIYATKLLDWALAFSAPFITMLWARIAAWSSLRRRDRDPRRLKKATRAYLYLDGAYCFIPMILGSACLFLFGSSDRTDISIAEWVNFLTLMYLLFLWFSLFPRSLFVLNGYSGKAAWVRRFWDRKTSFGPFYKYAATQCGMGFIFMIAMMIYFAWWHRHR